MNYGSTFSAGSEPRTNVSTVCPFSGIDTGIERRPDPELGAVSLDELETLVCNEWRRRLGSSSYPREHSRDLVRGLIQCALQPTSPVRSTETEQRLCSEVTRLRTWGMSRTAILQEFRELSPAVRRVLMVAGLDDRRSRDLAGKLAQRLEEILG
jgi:hypothetical protein